ERVFVHVAQHLDVLIFAPPRKAALLRLLRIPELSRRLVSDARQARVHVVDMRHLAAPALRAYVARHALSPTLLRRGLAVCFRATGWTFARGQTARRLVRGADGVVLYLLAYSEHCSFDELRAFVAWLRPCRLVPMVNARSDERRLALSRMLAHRDRPLRDASYEPSPLP
ncbi:unnamed protein product, partial [Agarophyton chilense]